MQLQLSLSIADRLHHHLLVRGEPLDTAEAAGLLLGASVAGPLSRDVIEVLVRDDRRFCWAEPGRESLTLSTWHGDDPDFSTVPFVALDLETTGAKAGAGKITEVGAVRIEGLRIVKHFQTLVNPQRPIPPMITGITGITQKMVADAPRIEDVIPPLLEFLEGAVVVAHNAPFDVGFLNYELHRLRSRRLGEGAIDTLPLSRALVPGLANYRLKTVAEALGAPVTACHRALADAQAVAHVFVQLAGVLQNRGVTRLSGVREHGRLAAPSYSEKLVLTRDLPESPGTFLFRDEDGLVLYVGRADHLASEVRSFFFSGSRRHRGLRMAVRAVEKIDWEETETPLEAVIREQELLSQHRPPCNPQWTVPEGYVYIRAGGEGPGVALSTTRRTPRWLHDPDVSVGPTHQELVLGPFRRRTAVQAAVALLTRCYPIRHCPRHTDCRPCPRGTQNLCLSPCVADAPTQRIHDTLVTALLMWLAGESTQQGIDPVLRAEETARDLSRKGLHDQARTTTEACEDLLAVRRSYDALASARRLSFACLWGPMHGNGRPHVRLNLVWKGLLRSCESLHLDTLEEEVQAALRPLPGSGGVRPPAAQRDLVAVRQCDLDAVLAVGRWFQESAHAGCILIPLGDAATEGLAQARGRLVAESRAMLTR